MATILWPSLFSCKQVDLFPNSVFFFWRRGCFWPGRASRRRRGRGQRAGGTGRSLAGSKQGSDFPRPRQLTALPSLFSDIESGACPASRLGKDMGTRSPYFEAGKKSLVVKRRNKTCLVTCHFNEDTNLTQVSIPHAPPLPPGSQVGGRKHRKTTSAPSEDVVTW